MRRWLLVILGVVGVAVVAVLGLSWYALNKPVDLNSATGQAYAENFRKQYSQGCLADEEKKDGTADNALKVKFAAKCDCVAEAVFEAYKNEPPAKVLTLNSD